MHGHRAPLHEDDEGLLQEINTTPLVDVMLVLLIIFLITLPMLAPSTSVALPLQRLQAVAPSPGAVTLSLDRHGALFWGTERLADLDTLTARLQSRRVDPSLESPVHVLLMADRQAPWKWVSAVHRACVDAGVASVAFLTDPAAAHRGGSR